MHTRKSLGNIFKANGLIFINNPGDEAQAPETRPPTITRRRFFKIAAAGIGALATAVNPTPVFAQNRNTNTASGVKGETPEADEAADEVTDEAEQPKGLKTIDLLTAGTVATAFAHQVLYRGAYRGTDLSPKSAKIVGGAEAARLSALALLGGEEGRHLATHEFDHLIKDMRLVPLLVMLSDMTTSEMQVNADKIFAKVQSLVAENFDYANLRGPDLSADLSTWQDHLKNVEGDLMTRAAQVAAITTVLSPLGTTYSSSALANNLKEGVLRILYQQSKALSVLKIKRDAITRGEGEGVIIRREDVEKEAIERAHKLMNGKMGYSKLMVTLACNSQGTLLAGDPPEAFFMQNHAHDPASIAVAQLAGLANSEFLTSLCTTLWLKKSMSGQNGSLKDLAVTFNSNFAVNQGTVIAGLKDFSIGRTTGHVKRIQDAVSDSDDPDGKLRDVLSNLPQPSIRLDLPSWLRKKLRHSAIKYAESIDTAEIHDLEEFASGKAFKQLAASFAGGDAKAVKAQLAALEEVFQQREVQEIAGLMANHLQESTETPAEPDKARQAVTTEATVEPSATEAEAGKRIMKDKATLSAVTKLSNVLISENESSREGRIKRAAQILGLNDLSEEDKAQQVFAALKTADASTVSRALAEFQSLPGAEDVIPGVDEHIQAGDSVVQAMPQAGHHGKTFITHNAKEVLWALLTQIPSVPALARLAEEVLPIAAGIEEGATPTVDQLKKMIWYMMTSEALMSAFADNVAAYLFAEGVLYTFFKRTFGEDVMQRHPGLEGKIGIVAKMVAEQAGSMSLVGNGPNFSQEELVLLLDDSVPQGVAINRQKISMPDSLATQNAFSAFTNIATVAAAAKFLSREADKIAANDNQPTTPQAGIQDTRRLINSLAA